MSRPDAHTPAASIIPRRAIRYGLILTAIVAVGGSAIGFLVAGLPGLASALAGAALTAIFMGLTAVSFLVGLRAARGDGGSPIFYGWVLGVWLVKLIVFLVIVLALTGQPWVEPRVLFAAVIVAVIGSLVVDVLAFLRSRVPLEVPLPGPNNGPRKP